MAESRYERQFGINTAQIKQSNSPKFYHYQGASYLVLLKILPQIFKHTQAFTFFDIGCGKGRAAFVAESCGYKKLMGIDLDEELILNANENLKIYKKREESKIDFYKSNALTFDYKNEPTVYFMFNPFNNDILKEVLDRILNATTSETYFIYMNPKHAGVFDDYHFELVNTIKTKRYTEAVIYKLKEINFL
ncbi:MAG: class I SAM-dependent methyltransferase [Bacteroidota bacterium]|nr:class I SAM-dependent methyltransferase [Bacteroidota bacterium]